MTHTKVITYRFLLPEGVTRNFSVVLGLPSHQLIADVEAASPPWTSLGFQQCPNCPLDVLDTPQCPVARNLVPVIETFRDCASSDEVDVTVCTEARDFQKRCSLQVGLSSLVGLIMATSGCPILDRLRPMVYTHLPFSNGKETTLRAIATYLLSQCIRERQGRTTDWALDRLMQTYDEVRVVNKAFAQRVRSMCGKDANVNAVVILDTFAGLASFALAKQWWKDIEPLFAPCADQHPPVVEVVVSEPQG